MTQPVIDLFNISNPGRLPLAHGAALVLVDIPAPWTSPQAFVYYFYQYHSHNTTKACGGGGWTWIPVGRRVEAVTGKRGEANWPQVWMCGLLRKLSGMPEQQEEEAEELAWRSWRNPVGTLPTCQAWLPTSNSPLLSLSLPPPPTRQVRDRRKEVGSLCDVVGCQQTQPSPLGCSTTLGSSFETGEILLDEKRQFF